MASVMTSDVQRLPKWLTAEPFALSYNVHKPHFEICIYDGNELSTYFSGSGNSISEAAKAARSKRREELPGLPQDRPLSLRIK
jgi:hypothetical protein